MRSYSKSSLFFWGWLFLFFWLGSSPLEAKERVSLQLRWDHQFQFAGYYAAEMMGYYDDVDLDVDIRSAITPELNILSATEEVASGRADFGVGAADILIRNHEGAKLKVLGTIFQHSAARLYVKNEKWPVPLATLAAKYRVARNINDLIDIEFQGMLRAEGIDPGEVKTFKHQPGLDHLIEGRVDVIPGYALTLPYDAEVAGLEIAEIKPQSFGIEFCGDSLFANEEIILKDPELVNRFFTASIKGWTYAIQNPEAVIDYLQRHHPRRFKTDYAEALNRHQATLIPELMHIDVVEPGYTHQHTWEKMHLTLERLGLIEGDFLADSLLWIPADEMQKTREKTQQSLVAMTIFLLAISLLIIWLFLHKVRRQRQELIESENLLSETLSSIQDPVFITDDKGRFTFIFPNVSHSLGYTADDLEAMGNISNLIGMNLFDAGELEKKGNLENIETVVADSNGNPKTFLTNVKSVAIGEGTRLFTMRDITERKRAEREHSLMHDRFVSIMNSLDALVYVADMENYELLFVNEYGRKLFGNIEGKICWQTLQSDQSEPCSFCTNHRLVENGEPTGVYVWEFQNTVTGGWFQCRDKAIHWHDNRLVRLEIATDISKQMLAAKELEKQKTTFESLFESIPDAILLMDMERRIVAINQGFTDIFGHTLDEVVGKPTSVIYANEEEFLRQESQRYNMSAEEAAKPYMVSYRSKGGKLVSGETISKKVLTPAGEVLGIFALIRDVSEKLKQEEAHRQAQKMEAIGILSGGISHDFNNLLAIISSNIEIIQHKQQTGTSSEENIGYIKETVSRAKNLVSQILAFSRQEKHALSPVDFTIVVVDSLKLLRSTIPVTVEILVEVESDPVFINADTTQIQQVLFNLCTNAVHAMDEKGLLRASLGKVESGNQSLPEGLGQQPGGYAKLSVSDTGCGIEKEHIERIFDPFFTTKDVGMGTGMGLSAAYGIVEQHGGVITVDSTPGQGTTFDIYLPVIAAQQQEPKTSTEDFLPTGNERILFVDDEVCIAESCCELLEYQGYTVTSVTNSSQALDLFKNNAQDFDLVFADQTMPGMTGVELAEELLKIRPDLPIILCSGYAAKVSEDVAKGIGIREFCMKPMDIKQLATVARKVLDENNSSS